MLEDFADKEFRGAFLEENLKVGVALQIRAIREKLGLSQPKLAKLMKKTQSVVSRLEDPEYGKFTIRTLLDLARAFDVALLVKFVPYSRLVTELKDLTPAALAVDSYEQECQSVENLVVTGHASTAASPPSDANKLPIRGAQALAARVPRDTFVPPNLGSIDFRSPLGSIAMEQRV